MIPGNREIIPGNQGTIPWKLFGIPGPAYVNSHACLVHPEKSESYVKLSLSAEMFLGIISQSQGIVSLFPGIISRLLGIVSRLLA